MLTKNQFVRYILKILFSLLFLGISSDVFSQTTASETTSPAMNNTEALLLVVLGLVLAISILILIVAIYLVSILKLIVLEDKKAKEGVESEVAEEAEKESWWKKLMSRATESVPVEQEEEILLDHEYDGIRELDNHLPPWWKWLFYVSIAWGFVYFSAYHVFHLFPLSGQEYENQMAEAKVAQAERMKLAENNIDENNVEFKEDPDYIAHGKDIFVTNCVTCHGEHAEGKIGPNLTDKYWLHGGSIKDLFNTIKYGVPAKGMISWQNKLSPSDIRDVATYVLSLQGSNPPNPKPPQGELYTPPTDHNQEKPAAQDTAKIVMR